MVGPIIVDTATPADAEAIGTLHARSFAVTYPSIPPINHAVELAVWRQRLGADDGREVIVARLDEGVVGFAYVGPSDDGNAEPWHGARLRVAR